MPCVYALLPGKNKHNHLVPCNVIYFHHEEHEGFEEKYFQFVIALRMRSENLIKPKNLAHDFGFTVVLKKQV
jgi:hypothetical protein